MKRLSRFPEYEYNQSTGEVRNVERGTIIRGNRIRGIPVERLIYETFHTVPSNKVVVGTRPFVLANLKTRRKKLNKLLSKRTKNLCVWTNENDRIYARSYYEMANFLGYTHKDVKDMLSDPSSKLKRVDALPQNCKRGKNHYIETTGL
jgi:hypothetical protein